MERLIQNKNNIEQKNFLRTIFEEILILILYMDNFTAASYRSKFFFCSVYFICSGYKHLFACIDTIIFFILYSEALRAENSSNLSAKLLAIYILHKNVGRIIQYRLPNLSLNKFPCCNLRQKCCKKWGYYYFLDILLKFTTKSELLRYNFLVFSNTCTCNQREIA